MNGPRRQLVALSVANLVPLLGFLFFDWSVSIFVGVLVLDVWATAFWAMVKIPFARKVPRTFLTMDGPVMGVLASKRGGITVSRFLPSLYPRNLTMIWPALFFNGWLVFFSIILFVLPAPTVTGETVGWMLLGGILVFALRGIDTGREYFYEGGYRNHSARTVILEPFQQLGAIGIFVLTVITGSGLLGDGEAPFISGTILVTIIFLGKFLADIRSWQLTHNPERTGLFTRIYGSPETEIEPGSVTVPVDSPAVVIRSSQPALVVDAIWNGFKYLASPWGAPLLFTFVLGVIGSRLLLTITAVGVLVLVTLRGVVYYLQYGTIEYRCYDDVIVVFDRLLAEPQACLEAWAVTDVKSRKRVLGQLFGTTSIVFETEWEPPSPSVSALTKPEEQPSIDPDTNRPLMVAHIQDSDQLFEEFDISWERENSC